ncbi:MAG TPA: hypothetical protein PK040_02105, partial [Anaerolineaceae bacterium]|nr:hypothetical protein [Anaerolineaceae bacterium]
MTVALSSEGKGFLTVDITGVASAANAGMGQILNPEGVRLAITRVYAYFATGSTGAANLDVGIGASGAKASDILSAFDMIEATVGGKAFFGVQVPVNEAEQTSAQIQFAIGDVFEML